MWFAKVVQILKWLAAFLFGVGSQTIGQISTKYAFKVGTVVAAITAFFVIFKATYTQVENLIQTGVSYAASYSGLGGQGIQFGLCILPSSIPLAITSLFTIAISAVIVRWTRLVLFSKIA